MQAARSPPPSSVSGPPPSGGSPAAAAGSAPLGRHLQAGVRAVPPLPRHAAAEVDDAALVRALVRRRDAGEPQLVGDVAAGDFHHLMGTKHDV